MLLESEFFIESSATFSTCKSTDQYEQIGGIGIFVFQQMISCNIRNYISNLRTLFCVLCN